MQQHLTTASLDLANLVKASLFGFNARVAAVSTLETAVTSRQPVSVPPPYQQDEAAIEAGHAQRRDMLARRRAEQQLAVLLMESQRLGIRLNPTQMARVVIDSLATARR